MKTLENYKEIFDVLISAFHDAKNIQKVEFSSIKKIFINSRIKKNKIDNVKGFINILKENSKLDPFYHTMKVEEKNEQLMLINKSDKNLGDLYDVRYKVYQYYNEEGKNVKTISKPVHKTFIKQLEKKEYKIQYHCSTTFWISGGMTIFLGIGALALLSVCPPAAFVQA